MKLIVAVLFAVLAISAHAEEEFDWENIDWSKVVPVTDMPGFWDGREIKPVANPRGMTRGGRIVGGEIVTPHTLPYQACLLMAFGSGTFICGGSLISNNRVLTAAHCPIGSTSTQVILGAHQFTVIEPTQQRQTVLPAQYRIHEQYNRSNLNNDIAILILLNPVDVTPQVQPINLAAADAGDFAGELATVSGWGRISDISASSELLRSVQNTIITNAECRATFSESLIILSTICMSGARGRGPCTGDSGGPLTIGRDGNREQIGVVSFGSGWCQAGSPSGFARVSSFRAWIDGQN